MNYLNRIQELLSAQEYGQAETVLQEWKQQQDFSYDATIAILESNFLMLQKRYTEALEMIYRGLKIDSCNYELYFLLAQVKELGGAYKQAQLSYENALFFSSDEDYDTLLYSYQDFCGRHPETAAGVSIILVTYNQLEMTKLCVESIRHNNLSTAYEIIVVDNLSGDGTREWLQEQEDIKYLLNLDNRGFPAACNQGAALAEEGNDLFFLNNDTIVMNNSIYNLRMALYEEEKTGITGPCSNDVSGRQRISFTYNTIDEYAEFANRNNCYSPELHEQSLRLIGFAMMCRSSAWKQSGGMDEVYGLGHFEDDDLCLQTLMSGYHLVFCPDSFIYHFGHASFEKVKTNKNDEYLALLARNKEIFVKKWGMRWEYLTHTDYVILEYIEEEKQKSFSVLDVNCGLGKTMLALQNQYPAAHVYGIEADEKAAEIGSHYLNIVQGDIERGNNPFQMQYDYILLGNVIEYLHDPKQTLCTLRTWLKPGGFMIMSFPNLLHISVLHYLLHGRLVYKYADIFGKSFFKLYIREEALQLLDCCHMNIDRAKATEINIDQQEELYLQKLLQMDSDLSREEMKYYQYIFKCH